VIAGTTTTQPTEATPSNAPEPRVPPEVEAAKRNLIEAIGMEYEQIGLPRMAGRIMGALMTHVPQRLSLPELCDTLGASKSSVSVMARLLCEMQIIRRVVIPGERREFYEMAFDQTLAHFQRRFNHFRELNRLMNAALQIMDAESLPESGEARKNLTFLRDFYGWLSIEMPIMLRQWDDWIRRYGYELNDDFTFAQSEK
jgi:DNA-binding transcriptional regulator GbsR (MarR family)